MPQTLLRPRILSLINSYKYRSKSRKKASQAAVVSGVLLLITGCTFTATYLLLTGISSDQNVRFEVLNKLIDLSAFALLWLIFLSSVIAAIGNFYGAENNFLLFTLPVSATRVFFTKFIETFFETTVMLYVFIVPALIAVAIGFDISLLAIAKILILGEFFLIIPCSLGIAVATFAVQIIHRIWSHGKLFIASAFIVTLLLIARISQLLLEHNAIEHKSLILRQIDNPSPTWLPSHWVSELVKSQIHQSDWQINYIYYIIATAACCFSLALFSYHLLRHFAREATMTQMLDAEKKTGIFRTQLHSCISNLALLFRAPQQTKAMAVKDLASLLRDKGQAVQLLLLLGVSGVYLSIFQSFSNLMALQSIALQLWCAILATLNVLFTGIILTTVMTRLVYPSISLEGKSFTILQSAPLSLAALLQIKTKTWLPISFLLSATIMATGLAAINAPIIAHCWGVLLAVFFSNCLTKIAVSIGALHAKFDWESVSQIQVGFGTMTLFATSLFFSVILAFASAPVFAIVIIPKLKTTLGPTTIISAIVVSALVLVLLLDFARKIFRKGELHLQAIAAQ